ncbi:cytochrome-c peroxidase [Roseateles koreensis]|uniref:Cytochrome c peroxidase n=1 Tax=Roseateles koreensis TaxID=2987526 RepID=A0ABT5KTJ5_9BURK|nr:cytochrome c peroxidase [Roseateles koreensis]MDC8786244.1 cytochrome c peroxidase [Roseateles koreensis]
MRLKVSYFRKTAVFRAAAAAGTLALLAFVPSRVIQACSDLMEPTGTDTHFPRVYGDRPTVAQLTDLGRRIFSDASLSASGRQSCASCHDPASAYGPPNRAPVQAGGPQMDRFGFRNTPSLRYLHSPMAFTEHFFEIEPTGGKDDQGPTGGRTWDGRVDSGHDQALMPLMDGNEMANASHEDIAARLRKSPYAADFARALSPDGENVLDDVEATVAWMTVALETFEQSPSDFHPFSSKFDAYLRDQVQLSPQEQRGMAVFNDMKKGNCASCHPSTHKNAGVRFPLFTDMGYNALGVPRNVALPANRKPDFFDLGLCGPLRVDLKERTEYCGMFRTPTLRNVALRHNFFHNGAVHTLREAVAFYATRDTAPQQWYPRGAGGKAEAFNDLPQPYQGNVYTGIPFKPLANGQSRLTGREIDDIVAFLGTLSDGYVPPKPGRRAIKP